MENVDGNHMQFNEIMTLRENIHGWGCLLPTPWSEEHKSNWKRSWQGRVLATPLGLPTSTQS
jgi:hypothetical protein